jgi:hypothetical protein
MVVDIDVDDGFACFPIPVARGSRYYLVLKKIFAQEGYLVSIKSTKTSRISKNASINCVLQDVQLKYLLKQYEINIL